MLMADKKKLAVMAIASRLDSDMTEEREAPPEPEPSDAEFAKQDIASAILLAIDKRDECKLAVALARFLELCKGGY